MLTFLFGCLVGGSIGACLMALIVAGREETDALRKVACQRIDARILRHAVRSSSLQKVGEK